jgi:hypothetical protein
MHSYIFWTDTALLSKTTGGACPEALLIKVAWASAMLPAISDNKEGTQASSLCLNRQDACSPGYKDVDLQKQGTCGP